MSRHGTPRHPNRDLERLIREAEDHGWIRSRGKGYFRLRCPCGLHQKSMVLTPSVSNYATNVAHRLRRQPCWETFR